MIKVLFFARIREQLGMANMDVAYSDTVSNLAKLQRELVVRGGPSWQAVLGAENVLCAVNQEEASADHALVDGDEVAFFPPVTGG